MTRKDYILIARALSKAERNCAADNYLCHRTVAIDIARALQEDNSDFDYGHFMAVVGGEKALTSRPVR